jgi:hypothetical protein
MLFQGEKQHKIQGFKKRAKKAHAGKMLGRHIFALPHENVDKQLEF